MLKFVRNWFRSLVSNLLWLFLIIFTIIGYYLGDIFYGYTTKIDPNLLGALFGLVIGTIIIVLVGGYIATIMNIDENLEKLVKMKNDNLFNDKKEVNNDEDDNNKNDNK